jgi:hypothetical protein
MLEISRNETPLRRKPVSLFFTLLLFFALLGTGCHRATQPAPAAAAPQPAATAPQATATATFRSPSGKTYQATAIGPADNDEPVVIPPVAPGAAPSMDNYHGTARKAAKLSIATGSPQNFPDIGAVLDSLIPDDQMRAMGISTGADSERLPQEETVVIVNGFLYAASRESDNDFHCIVGTDPSQPPARLMNVEVSGLPASSSPFFVQLKTARNEFKAFFSSSGDALPTSGYKKYEPPIPVEITGSLFYDVDHAPGAIGPDGMRPTTSWEIHPVSDIQFEAQQ